MFTATIRRQGLRNLFTAGLLMGATVILLTYPSAMTTGINRGLALCARVILPTLYPFMLLAGITANSSLCRQPGRWAHRITRRLFGLPGCCGPAILLSLVGGYPAGVVAIAELYRNGQITRRQVERMTAYCVGGGPGFIITTVGIGMLGNITVGILLFIAQVVTSLLFGFLLGHGHHDEKDHVTPVPTESLPFSRIVGNTCSALLCMCGFVTAAAMVLSLAEGSGLCGRLAEWAGISAGWISAAFAGLLEVSSGCLSVAKTAATTPLFLCLCISWGGLSVHGQLAAAIPECRLLTPRFWLWRLAHGVVSGTLATLLFRLCPPTLTTAVGTAATLPHTVSGTASTMLLCLSFLAMLQFCEKKTGNVS